MKRFITKKGDQKHKSLAIRFSNQFWMWMLLLPALSMVFFIQWIPVLKGMWMSLFETKGYSTVGFVGLENYKNILTDTIFSTTLLNTFKYVFWSIVIGAIPPFILALFLNEIVHGRNTFRFLTYLPNVAPALAVSIIWSCIYSPAQSGLFNSILSTVGIPPQQWLLDKNMTIPLIILSMSWSGAPGTALIYYSALQGISQDLYEAATLDGAGMCRKLFTVTIPQIAPTLLLMIVRQVISVFQIMQEPLIMTNGGPSNASLSLNLSSYNMAFVYGQVDRSLALGTVTFIILIIITIFYLKLEKKISD